MSLEQEYLEALNGRCSISKPSKCFSCRVIKASDAYVEQLQAQLDNHRKAFEKLKVIVGRCAVSDWRFNNIEQIREAMAIIEKPLTNDRT